ncbi:MAG: peptidoglycan DD-metalloendopeptidase family protein [candidate division KSB1 bacterium]|nr:peptidoglycan DD-metalloendopeptidase family protein [candidate division KSB1 bacterium]MDZ7368383.1 peptidoglycan DD-metalloendopeptidase family protein [candidate division KSB1 bacterium]MDZ7406041.1 peptidoglycan DD-metalloendopeptidase family protein [candidate division KSB1 bacterium]
MLWLRLSMLILLSPALLFSQDQRRQLDELRQKIARLQEQIAAQEKNETATLEFLRALDEQIDLTHRLATQLRKQERDKRAKIDNAEKMRQRTEDELQRLKKIAAERAVFFYKYGRMQDVEILLTARSLNQMLLWAKYHQQLDDNDRRILNGIAKKREQISEQKTLLTAELENHQRILSEKQQEEEALKKRRAQRQEVLKKVRSDKNFYQAQLAETQKAMAHIRQLISSAEAKAPRREPVRPAGDGSFQALRKAMPWPVDGRIVSRYGNYRHPVLNTITNNLGIDIAPQDGVGATVRSVASGKVTAITWQRGYGNLMIISHGEGYYTVYTHLADLNVSLNEEVAAEQVIGTVGETGSLQGATLHFQIWNREEALNPEDWLRP